MALISTPDFLKRSMETAQLTLERTDFQMRSAFTRQRQVLSWPSGHMWVASCTVPNLAGTEANLMRAFLVDMDGRANTCRFPVPGYRGPSNGYGGPAGLVNGAGQSGFSLVTDGWPANTTVLLRGDFVTINGELKMVMADVVTNGAGQATLTFKPALRYSPPDNAPIVITDPYAVMSMSDSNAASWSLRAPRFHGFQLALEEAVNAP